MNHGEISLRLGLSGIPNVAEEIFVARDLRIAKITEARLHISQMSTAGSVEQLRQAKRDGSRVSGDITPHHFTLTEDEILSFDPNFKMIPPLRAAEDLAALIEGLRDGAIDAIVSGHAPHAPESKDIEFQNAPFGVIGLETLFPLSYSELVVRHGLPLSTVISKLTIEPARILGLAPQRGTLEPGAIADISVFDIGEAWEVDVHRFHSKSRNSPFHGRRVHGKTRHVIVGGRIVFRDGAPSWEEGSE